MFRTPYLMLMSAAAVDTQSAVASTELNTSPGEVISGHAPKFQQIDISRAIIDDSNPRTPERFKANVERIKASYARNGYKSNHPVAVHELTNGDFEVLVGNTRVMGAQELAASDPAMFKKVFPKGTIPAFVYRGLNDAEKAILRVDHGTDEDRMQLDEWEEFLAVKKLRAVGLTQDAIARQMGWLHTSGKDEGKPNRSYVQPRVTLAQLPAFIQDAMQAKLQKKAGNIVWRDIPKLYTAFNEDNAEGLPHPNGGPVFNEVWSKIQNPPSKGSTIAPATLTPAAAKASAKITGSVILKMFLLFQTGQLGRPDLTLTDFDNALRAMEASTPDVLAKFLAPPVVVELSNVDATASGKPAKGKPAKGKPAKAK